MRRIAMVLAALAVTPPAQAAQLPPTWNYKFTSGGQNYLETFIGGDPAKGGTETIDVYIIPIKMVWKSVAYSNSALLPDGKTVLRSVLGSPIFQPTEFTFGQTALGKLQYGDAFQKANLWNAGGSNPSYHVLLGKPVIEPEQTLHVPDRLGTAGNTLGAVDPIIADDIWFFKKLPQLLRRLHVPTKALPIFLTTQTYLYVPGGGCCLAFNHSLTRQGQPWIWGSDIQNPAAFSQDVSGLTAALGGWLDDPYLDNISICGGYEVAGPLLGEPNYGAYPYKKDGFTYNLTDLLLLPYFGDSSGATLDGLETLQGTSLTPCQDGD